VQETGMLYHPRVQLMVARPTTAQCAPPGHAGFVDIFCQCAQTRRRQSRNRPLFSGDLEKATVQETAAFANDCECKISIHEVLISVTLSVCGEVAERLKAAVF